jgi:hypothetical protein
MILRELTHARLSSVLAVLGVAIPVGAAAYVWCAAARHAADTEELTRDKERSTAAMVAAMQQEYQAIGGRMPPDLFFIASTAQRGELLTQGYVADRYSDALVDTLAARGAGLFTHLLPVLSGPWTVDGFAGKVLVVGEGEERVLDRRSARAPRNIAAPGFAFVGYELCAACSLSAGAPITLGARRLFVAECAGQQGSVADITVRMSLFEAREILRADGSLSVIGAVLRDPSLSADTILAQLMPAAVGLQMVGPSTVARTRTWMETAAAGVSDDVLRAEQGSMRTLSAGGARVRLLLTLAAGLSGLAWITIVTIVNLHGRRAEIGVLSALGLGHGALVALLAGRGMTVGVLGAFAGAVAAALAGGWPAAAGEWMAMGVAGLVGVLSCCLVHIAAALGVLRRDLALVLTTTGV